MIYWITLCILSCTALLYFEWKRSTSGVWLSKPMAAFAYVGAAIASEAFSSTFGVWIFVGLCLSWLGDILLIPKQNEPAFLVGIGSFLFAHVAYSIAFISLGLDLSILFPALLIGLLVIYAALRWLAPHLKDFFRLAVPFYVTVIVVMICCSISATSSTGNWYVALGALMFALSDLSVAKDRLIKEDFLNRSWGLPLYFAAQFVLVGALRF